jgi:hypothetical protein
MTRKERNKLKSVLLETRRKRNNISAFFAVNRLINPWLLRILGLVVLVLGGVFITLVFLSFRQRIWNGSEKITIAVQNPTVEEMGGEVYLVSFNPQNSELKVINFPENMTIEAFGDYGKWRLRSIYSLGEIEGNGGLFLRKSLESFFGIEVESYLVLSDRMENGEDGIAKLIAKNVLKANRKTDTNLDYFDRLMIWYGLNGLSQQRIRIIDFNKQNILNLQVEPDGSELLIPNLEMLDAFSKKEFAEPLILNEGLVISIINTTDHQGLGREAMRLITNTGGTVIYLGDNEKKYATSQIEVNNQSLLETFTTMKLKKYFPNAVVSVSDTTKQRSDIVLYIGEDYQKMMQTSNE